MQLTLQTEGTNHTVSKVHQWGVRPVSIRALSLLNRSCTGKAEWIVLLTLFDSSHQLVALATSWRKVKYSNKCTNKQNSAWAELVECSFYRIQLLTFTRPHAFVSFMLLWLYRRYDYLVSAWCCDLVNGDGVARLQGARFECYVQSFKVPILLYFSFVVPNMYQLSQV